MLGGGGREYIDETKTGSYKKVNKPQTKIVQLTSMMNMRAEIKIVKRFGVKTQGNLPGYGAKIKKNRKKWKVRFKNR